MKLEFTMKKIVSIGLWIFAAVALVLFFSQLEVSETESANNNGRDKLEISAGETQTWTWTPSFETNTVSFWVSGKKNAEGLVVTLSISEGESVLASDEWTSAQANDMPTVSGSFHPGKTYRISVRASGDGSARLRGGMDADDHFTPYLLATGRTVLRNHMWLYLSLVLALFPLMPLPKPTQTPKDTSASNMIAG